MSNGKHTPSGDRSFAISVLAHLAAGVALVLAVAGAFWGLGQVRAPDTTPVITAPDDTPDPTSEAADTDEPADEPAGTPADAPDESEEPDDADEPADADEPDETDETDEPDEPADTRAHAPQDVSVQILDAAGDDGTRTRVAEGWMRDDGYGIVATGRAIRTYEQTTVFYTPGAEDKAQQVAAEYGYPVVEEKPDNLSDSVDVHVIVGQDHPTG